MTIQLNRVLIYLVYQVNDLLFIERLFFEFAQIKNWSKQHLTTISSLALLWQCFSGVGSAETNELVNPVGIQIWLEHIIGVKLPLIVSDKYSKAEGPLYRR